MRLVSINAAIYVAEVVLCRCYTNGPLWFILMLVIANSFHSMFIPQSPSIFSYEPLVIIVDEDDNDIGLAMKLQ